MGEGLGSGAKPCRGRRVSADGRPHVAIVGGGLAGIAAAFELIDSGAKVTLFERRNHLGGATWSFDRQGRSFDNGQHVYLRCCTAYRRLLERLGTASGAPLQARLSVPVLRARQAGEPDVAVIARTSLPAPLHLGASLLTYSHLSIVDRGRLGIALRALRDASLRDLALDDETFGDFLRRNGQSARAIAGLWDLITLPTTNLRSDVVSALCAIKVFKTGLLEESDAADIGWSRLPLQTLHGDPALRLLRRAGVTVELRAKVEAVTTRSVDGSTAASAIRVNGADVDVDQVVLAVPHMLAVELAPTAAGLDFAALTALGSSPIVDVHLVYASRVVEHEICAALDSPVQFVFDATESAIGTVSGEQVLACSVSGASAEIGERPEVLIDRYRTAISNLFPLARTVPLLDAVVTREHQATFAATPGTNALRPFSATNLANLFLAGSWTNTGWPATMEGAVRSGNAAAWNVRHALGERLSATGRDAATVSA